VRDKDGGEMKKNFGETKMKTIGEKNKKIKKDLITYVIMISQHTE
jgi:hypothetical protein